MILTRLAFNPRCSRARQALDSPYELHRILSGWYEPEARPRLLFRQLLPHPRVLLLSRASPDLEADVEEGLLTGAQSKPFAPKVSQGLRLRFQLRANPTKKESGKRRGLECPVEQCHWLERKGLQHGFGVLSAEVVRSDVAKTERPDGRVMVHLSADFRGGLEVTEPALFGECLTHGVGSAKAFGFGLMMVSR